jgi:transcriptional regulator with XRE-family HTH domain
MLVNNRLRTIRESKRLSQTDMAERLGISRSYLILVENDGTVPSIELLKAWAQGLVVPFYQLFYDGEEPPPLPNLPGRLTADEIASTLEKNL